MKKKKEWRVEGKVGGMRKEVMVAGREGGRKGGWKRGWKEELAGGRVDGREEGKMGWKNK